MNEWVEKEIDKIKRSMPRLCYHNHKKKKRMEIYHTKAAFIFGVVLEKFPLVSATHKPSIPKLCPIPNKAHMSQQKSTTKYFILNHYQLCIPHDAPCKDKLGTVPQHQSNTNTKLPIKRAANFWKRSMPRPVLP